MPPNNIARNSNLSSFTLHRAIENLHSTGGSSFCGFRLISPNLLEMGRAWWNEAVPEFLEPLEATRRTTQGRTHFPRPAQASAFYMDIPACLIGLHDQGDLNKYNMLSRASALLAAMGFLFCWLEGKGSRKHRPPDPITYSEPPKVGT